MPPLSNTLLKVNACSGDAYVLAHLQSMARQYDGDVGRKVLEIR